MRWFRFYDEVLDDPKVQRLPPALFKHWVNLLCLARRHEGKLPDDEAVAFALRLPSPKARGILAELQAAGLFDDRTPHNWRQRQFQSDDAYQRVKRCRGRFSNDASLEVGNVSDNVDETAYTRGKAEAEAEHRRSRANA